MKKSLKSLIKLTLILSLIACNKETESNVEIKTKGMSLSSSTSIDIDGWIYPYQSNTSYKKWGICYGTTENPTIENNSQIESSQNSTSYTVNIPDLVPDQEYYARAYFENINKDQILYGLNCKFTMPSIQIGELKEGGVVFWVDPNDTSHGLVCSLSSFSDARWSFPQEVIDGADGSSVGDGYQNTVDIINGSSYSISAADQCVNLVQNGYSDWFLPSAGELYILSSYRDIVNNSIQDNGGGGFLTQSNYWSSSEYDVENAIVVDFGTDGVLLLDKNTYQGIRAIRAF
jgi:hypothetical protein